MDPPPPYTPLLDANSEVAPGLSDEKISYAPADGGEPSTRYTDDILVADGVPPSDQPPTDEPGEISAQFPPIPPVPEEPKHVDHSQILDPVVRKLAEKETERAWKRYEKAMKDRAKMVRDREKALGKMDRRKGKQIEGGEKDRRKEDNKEEKEHRKEVRDAEKRREREGKERMKELRDIDREERRRIRALKDEERENQRSRRDIERAEREKSKELKDWEAEKTQDYGRGRRDQDCGGRRASKNTSPQQMGCPWRGQAPPGDENGQSSGIIESSMSSHSHASLVVPPAPTTFSST